MFAVLKGFRILALVEPAKEPRRSPPRISTPVGTPSAPALLAFEPVEGVWLGPWVAGALGMTRAVEGAEDADMVLLVEVEREDGDGIGEKEGGRRKEE